MTEGEWLDCASVRPMIEELRGTGQASARKLRLLCCAYCRRTWDEIPEGWYRRAVQISEWHADGRASPEELKEAEQVAQAARAQAARHDFDHPLLVAAGYTAGAGTPAATVASLLTWALGQPDERWACALVREVFGNPFRPVSLDPAWLTFDVRALAREIYDAGTFDQVPVLGDALEDAGCTEAALLDHCRQGGHVRGCWVVDLVLGRP
jgi:hypothetical protein